MAIALPMDLDVPSELELPMDTSHAPNGWPSSTTVESTTDTTGLQQVVRSDTCATDSSQGHGRAGRDGSSRLRKNLKQQIDWGLLHGTR